MILKGEKKYKTRDAAKFFGVTPHTIRRWAQAFHIGFHMAKDCDWHFSDEDIREFEEKAKQMNKE
jgi:predicted site-specific integrase-resolvase